jgi:deoxyribodipyrimidine photo-lyase
MSTSIVWFKTDLRLHDNETFVKAVESGNNIVPVYCFDESHYGTTEFGFKKTGNFRAKFLLESLEDLNTSLQKIGSQLVIVKGKPEEEIYKIAQKYSAKKLFVKKEVAEEELNTHDKVEKALWKIGCSVEVFSTSTLYHAMDLPFSIKDIPDVFTNFRKKVEKESKIRSVFKTPLKSITPTLPNFKLPSLTELGLEEVVRDARSVYPFTGGETKAFERLHYYFSESKLIARYKETRNGLIGKDYSSKFSAWLALGCISPREIYEKTKQYEETYGANDSTYWLIFELIWRDYFRFMFKKHHHKFFLQSGINSTDKTNFKHCEDKFTRWKNGATGIDFIDANMNELNATGFMSNRGRQNVASYLCNDLKIDWRYGAAYFEQQLIDYDVCSNWGNWAYVAGVGNDPRKDRYFNIEKQANDYDKNGTYRKLWLS